jgi:hypothetical protein
LHRAIDDLVEALGGPDWPAAVAAVADELRAARALPDAFGAAGDDPLAAEVGPWAAAARREAVAGLAALRLLQQLRPVAACSTAGAAHAAPPDAELAMQHAFLLLGCWEDARHNELVAYGSRFALRPGVVRLADGRVALDLGLSVVRDANAVDRLCSLALDEYRSWCESPAGPVIVRIDGEPEPADPDAFALDGRSAILQLGAAATRVFDGIVYPFRDARLA